MKYKPIKKEDIDFTYDKTGIKKGIDKCKSYSKLTEKLVDKAKK